MFNTSKYSKWYYTLIEKARKRVFAGKPAGYHYHHIIPRSLGGSDHHSNICLLTYREHMVAHMLLVKMTSGKQQAKMGHALRRFSGKNKCSRSFAVAARLISLALSGENNPMYGKSLTVEHRMKISGKNHGMYGTNLTAVWTEKYGEEATEILESQRRQRISAKVSGEKNGQYGREKSAAEKQHQADAITGRIGLLDENGKQRRLHVLEAVKKFDEGWEVATPYKYRKQKLLKVLVENGSARAKGFF